MKPHVNLNHFSKDLLKVAACLAIGTAISAPVAYAEPLQATQSVQNGTVSGVVTDSQGEPIIGASVIVKGTSEGVATDLDGRFTVKASAGQEITISSIGYKPVTVTVGNSPLNIVLEEDSQMLDDVVVIGYGTQRKGDVTSAVSQVKAEDFTLGNVNNAGDLIKGKVAGLTITKPSGDPGAGTEMRLRGIVSVSGNTSPLVLIDGVPGDMSTVPPENIASIDVLKDASAAAIYGTRGAAGVVLITTKTGKREQAATATYSGYISFSNWAKKAEFMSAADVRNGATNFPDSGYDTDWLKAVSRTAVTQNHSFSISGGSASTTYYGNFTYREAEGVLKKTGNNDYSMSFDVSHWMLNDMLKVNLNVVADLYKYDINDAVAIYRQAVIRNPTSPIYNEDGTYYQTSNPRQYYNPVGMQAEQSGEAKSQNIRMTGNITLEPIKGWKTNVMMATHRYMYDSGSYLTKNHSVNGVNGLGSYSGSASIGSNNSTTNYLEITSNYNAFFNNIHRFDGLIGYSYSDEEWENSSMWNGDFPTDYFGYHNIGSGSKLDDGAASMSSEKQSSKLIGFFGRISYGYDNRYNVLASIRYEGSSRFGKNHKWGAFPSVSLGWNIINEEFMESTKDWLSNLKFRTGYGITGVIPGFNYGALRRYTYSGGMYYKDGVWSKVLQVSANNNPDLKWETSGEFNVGIDMGFLNERISATVDWYNKTTKDMLYYYNVPVPPNYYDGTWANVGKMRNSGIEVMIKAIPVQTRDFDWTTTFTLQHNSNKLVSLSNDLYETDNTQWMASVGDPVSQITHKLQVGEALGQIWSLKAVGISSATGKFLIENPETGLAAEYNTSMRSDMNWYQYIGNGIPKVTIGWNHQFRYRDFDLSMQFNGQFGFKIINQQRVFYENKSHGYNWLKSTTDVIGGIRELAFEQEQVVTSYHIENGDYFKMSNLTLGYTLPLTENKYVKNIRVYGAIDNVFTITKYKGIDPELGTSDFYTPASDNRDKYPTIRSFTVGLNVTF